MKFFEIIRNSGLGDWVDSKRMLVEKTDPDNFYPEEFRAVFGLPTSVSKFICNLAVREGRFRKKSCYMNPIHNRVILILESGENPPEIIEDPIAIDREEEQSEFKSSECPQYISYSLNE